MNYHNQGQYAVMAEGFMTKVYGWMCAGLAISAGVTYYIMSNVVLLQKIVSNFGLMIGLTIVSFGLILMMSFAFAKMSYAAVVASFLSFTVLQGITLTPVLLQYTQTSVATVFLISSLMFLGMALYGTFTKADLSSMGNILLMGLWGLIVCGLVNMFFQNSLLQTMISACGVGIFAMLIAYDVQMLRRLSQQVMMTPQDAGKFAVMGALNLYLNMINLFLYLLQLFGDKEKK